MTATTVSQAVEKRQSGPVSIMWGRRAHFDAVLPASVDVEAFLGTAAGALYASDVPGKKLTLMGCAAANPDSLIVALMECAALGHMPGTDEYYLTPRLDHGRPKVLGIEGYRGVIERMYRSGAVASVVVREVCAKDPFEYVEGRDRVPLHEVGGQGGTGAAFFGEKGSRDRGEMVGVYAYAELLTGAVSRVVLLNRDDIFAARDSGGYKPDDQFSPWNRLDAGKDHPEMRGRSMWWKTGAKRLEPWVPTSAEYRREQLRASAAAGSLAPSRTGPAAAGPPPDLEIHDAVIVDDTPDVPPADAVPPQHAGPASPPQAGTAGGTPLPPLPGEEENSGPGVQDETPGSGPAPGPEPDERDYDTPGTVTKAQLTRLGATFTDLGFTSREREQRLVAASQITGRELTSSSELSKNEAGTLIDTLARCEGDREKLIALLAEGEVSDE